MSEVLRRPAADRDLVAIFRHYARQAGMRVADRFFVEAEATFARLAGQPGMGTPYEPDEPLYASLRYVPVSRYRVYVIFYRPIPNGVEIYRVLHGARDIHGILAQEFGIKGDAGDDQTDEG